MLRLSQAFLRFALLGIPSSQALAQVLGDNGATPLTVVRRIPLVLANRVAELPAEPRSVARLPNGVIVVSFVSATIPPAVFDAAGRARGALDIPGGIRGVANVTSGPGDSILALDWGAKAMHVFDSELRHSRSTNADVHAVKSVHWLNAGGVVVTGHLATGERAGVPVVLLQASNGQFVRGIDVASSYTRDAEGFLWREVGRARDGGFWVVGQLIFDVKKFDSEGRRVSDVPKFQQPRWLSLDRGLASAALSDDETPPSIVYAIQEDAEGHVWLMCAIPFADWRARGEFVRRARREGSADSVSVATHPAAMYRSMFAVYRAHDGELIGSYSYDSPSMKALGGNMFLEYQQDARGAWQGYVVQLAGTRLGR